MRKITIILLLLALLLVGCRKNDSTPSTENKASTAETFASLETTPTPEMLIGAWRSLDPGELDMVETIEIFEDGSITVNCQYQGKDAGTIYGTYYVSDDVLHCDMFSNGAPYMIEYRFELDGRELILQDDDGPAHYIKVS